MFFLKFQKPNGVSSFDICQVCCPYKGQPYELILWHSNPSQPLSIHKLKTVTYGLKTPPLIAIRTLKQLAPHEGNAFPHATDDITRNIYVEDIITGFNDLNSTLSLQVELKTLLKIC